MWTGRTWKLSAKSEEYLCRDRCAAEKDHRKVAELDQNLTFLHGIRRGRDHHAESAKSDQTESDEKQERAPVGRPRQVIVEMRNRQYHQNVRYEHKPCRHHGSHQQGRWTDGRNLVTAQYSHLSFLDGAHACAK